MMNEILEKLGLKYEDLNSVERETLTTWEQALSKNALTVQGVADYVQAMKNSVENELIDEPEFLRIFIFRIPNRKQLLLKARLKNYLLLEVLLSSPQKAKEAIERQLASLVSTK